MSIFRNIISATALAVTASFYSTPAAAGDPACDGGDQSTCDMLATMIAAKGRGCHKMMSVTPAGRGGWRVNCQVSSTSSSRVTYVLQFSDDQTSYTLR